MRSCILWFDLISDWNGQRFPCAFIWFDLLLNRKLNKFCDHRSATINFAFDWSLKLSNFNTIFTETWFLLPLNAHFSNRDHTNPNNWKETKLFIPLGQFELVYVLYIECAGIIISLHGSHAPHRIASQWTENASRFLFPFEQFEIQIEFILLNWNNVCVCVCKQCVSTTWTLRLPPSSRIHSIVFSFRFNESIVSQYIRNCDAIDDAPFHFADHSCERWMHIGRWTAEHTS